MGIREFRESDIDAVFEIQMRAYRPLYEKYHDDEISPYMESKEKILGKYLKSGTKGYLFMENGIPVGAVRILLDPVNRCAKVSALAVIPEYQGRGIAQRALLQIERLHGDIDIWRLDTILQEKGNCHLYEKLGYVKTGKIKEIKAGMSLVFYEKHKVNK